MLGCQYPASDLLEIPWSRQVEFVDLRVWDCADRIQGQASVQQGIARQCSSFVECSDSSHQLHPSQVILNDIAAQQSKVKHRQLTPKCRCHTAQGSSQALCTESVSTSRPTHSYRAPGQ